MTDIYDDFIGELFSINDENIKNEGQILYEILYKEFANILIIIAKKFQFVLFQYYSRKILNCSYEYLSYVVC